MQEIMTRHPIDAEIVERAARTHDVSAGKLHVVLHTVTELFDQDREAALNALRECEIVEETDDLLVAGSEHAFADEFNAAGIDEELYDAARTAHNEQARRETDWAWSVYYPLVVKK